ncbi:transposase mutator type [Thermotomaculum hydrothermale]|uniref:Mutator family transposase n=2 Tax=Thermotomaculum hydrothermale TaxID=981385 RepID=A0A7R6PUK3_9BACT|nr:IS256 family transposase [Thermotomaculum hydrothermale]BBB31823.1 transposase mutator type [Thermotomaculum hydrothermale]BBB32790.1 transposase mutator type [Thermotomaculum hydrothermale]BBB32839.1 transposase mutator type [Thermotomaculum hydrothermale]BBB32952.1 transposase mutator type [Thermotomaculum hydrothermale]BBB32968.1 transposase mutator type [Thermotomaculum hydrothermale]
MSDLIFTQFKEFFKKMLQEMLLEERERYLKEARGQTRANGYYKRTPKSFLGEIELQIPRTRDSQFKVKWLPQRKRVMFFLEDIVEAMFIAGVSTRKTAGVIKNLIGANISAQYVSRISEISEEVIEKWKNSRLTKTYPVLYIDATYISLKRDSVAKEAVYAVLGLSEDGKREILGYFLPGGNEKASLWQEIFRDLKERGLKGVKLIISDDLTGLSEAIKEEFPETMHQLCWFHLKRNIKNRVRKHHFEKIKEELDEIMKCESREEGKTKLLAFIEKWKKIYRFLKNIKAKVDNYTFFLLAPDEIRSYFRTTNWMERCFKELKDYIRIRGFFQNEQSAEKFLYIFFTDKNEKYQSRSLRYSSSFNRFFSSLSREASHA